MGGVSPETFWATYKYGIIKVLYIVAFCWIFLYKKYYNARIHKHQILFYVTERRANDCDNILWTRHFVLCGHLVVGHPIVMHTEPLSKT